MRILGVDPGLRVCGYGLIEGVPPAVELIEAGLITSNSKQKLQSRLHKIHKAFEELVSEFEPEALVLERLYSHYRHPATAFMLGHARGVICLLCSQYNIKLFEYLPTRIKKTIVGKGHASKMQVKNMIIKALKLRNKDIAFDITDALALALGHIYIYQKKRRK